MYRVHHHIDIYTWRQNTWRMKRTEKFWDIWENGPSPKDWVNWLKGKSQKTLIGLQFGRFNKRATSYKAHTTTHWLNQRVITARSVPYWKQNESLNRLKIIRTDYEKLQTRHEKTKCTENTTRTQCGIEGCTTTDIQ